MQWSTLLPALVCCGVCTVLPDLVYCSGLYCRLWYTVLTVLVYCGVLYTCGTGTLWCTVYLWYWFTVMYCIVYILVVLVYCVVCTVYWR